ncbi:alpha/beta hydrolase [Novosphingobium sp. BL-8A]|uniref:alpha/beta hydrolase n=1 Tax=Novosphingobium sp. BL-8A TaxID=3127639 RepID=UPI0037571D11
MKGITLSLTALAFAASVAVSGSANGQEPGSRVYSGPWKPGADGEQIPLWPAGTPLTQPDAKEPESVWYGHKLVGGRPYQAVIDVTQPTMTIYRPKGHNSGAALMVFPGGGYEALAIDLEGSEVCDWATRIGMTCVLLKYRVPQNWHPVDREGQYSHKMPTPFLPLQDAERAMGVLRQRASSLGIDPHKIGVVGFSAGGHLVTAISNTTGRSYPRVDAADDLSVRPDFAMPIYPGHLWSGQGGTGQDAVKLFDFDPVRADAPPTFIVQAENDPVDDVRNSISYFLALKAANVPADMHIYATGGHAFGLRQSAEPITHWTDLAEKWLHTIGMI